MKEINLNDLLEHKFYNKYLKDYLEKINNLDLNINNNSISCLFILNEEQLNNAINNNLKAINKLKLQGKSNEFIQEFINNNYYIFYEVLPDEVKENPELLKMLSIKYNEKSLLEKTKWINELNKVSMGKGLLDLQNKQRYLAICLEDESLKQNKKLSQILKGLPAKDFVLLQKDLSKEKSKNKKKSYINRYLECKNKEEKEVHLYNKEYYDLINDKRLSMDKIDIIKHAYFQNGIDLNDFKKDLDTELYKCSREQLENYVETFTKYTDGYISKEEYFFSKKIIHNEDITQEEIKKDILPTIENYDLTERQINECIAIGSNRNKGDARTYIDLCIEAKEHNYSNFEINEILDDCKDKSTMIAHYKKEMIKEYGNDNLTSVENLNNYTEKEMVYLLKERELALELNRLPNELTHEQIGVEL